MKKIQLIVQYVLAIMCLSFLTGCSSYDFNEDERTEQIEQAEELMEDYLSRNYPGGMLEDVSLHVEVVEGNYCQTDFVDGGFIYEGEEYRFVVNTETGEIYTSCLLEEAGRAGIEYVLETLEISSQEILDWNFYIKYPVSSKGELSETAYEGDTYLENVLMDSFQDPEDIIEFLKNEECNIMIQIVYAGENSLKPEGYDLTDLPGVSSLTLWHAWDKEELPWEISFAEKSWDGRYDYDYRYMVSEYIAVVTKMYDGGSGIYYSKWDYCEGEDFLLTYECYHRIENSQGVQEQQTGSADILLREEQDFVEVESLSNTTCYLFAKANRVKEKEGVKEEQLLQNGGSQYEEKEWIPVGDCYILGIVIPQACDLKEGRGPKRFYQGKAEKEK